MLITLLKVLNFQKITDIEIAPGDRSLLLIGGNNAQGKTSVLQAMSAALGGGSEKPDRPVRKGEDYAEIIIELDGGETVVTKTFTKEGKASLKVVTQEFGKISAPQKALDRLVGSRFLDPLAFTRLSESEQRDELIKVVKIDLDLDKNAKDRKRVFEARTNSNRDVKRLTAESASFGKLPTIPEKMEMSKLLEKIGRLQSTASQAEKAADDIAALKSDTVQKDFAVEQLEAELATAKARQAEARKRLDTDRETLANVASIDVRGEMKKVRDQMDECESHNAEISVLESNARAAESVAGKLFEAESTAGDLDRQLKALDKAKSDALGAAKMPVEGLSLSDSAVLLNGVPLSQASGAEAIQLSLAIASATSPQIRDVWIQDGSLLDYERQCQVKEFAEANDLRVWLEVVGDKHEDCLVIEEGAIRAD